MIYFDFYPNKIMKLVYVFIVILVSTYQSILDDQTSEIVGARCYSKCLQLFVRFKSITKAKAAKNSLQNTSRSSIDIQEVSPTAFLDEISLHLSVSPSSLRVCLEDERNDCSRQCLKSCTAMSDCTCQQNDLGCSLACYFRKEIARESTQEDCHLISTVAESALKMPISRCPKTCKTKTDCSANQQCCPTETCGSICLQIEDQKLNLPKYTPTLTQSSTHSSFEFDWSENFSKHLRNESPLVFILQTRTCLCHKFLEKYVSPWETLLMTHRLGAKLNALDNGTIYQFRLAVVSPEGTNGFGNVSTNLPAVLMKPPPPFPPENLMEYKWQVTEANLFKVEVKWNEPKPSTWRSFEYLLSWMVDHDIVQYEGEHLSSLTQYTKTLPGSVHQSTIGNLRPQTTYKIQIVTKSYWPGFGDILSLSATMYVTTPTTNSSKYDFEGGSSNMEQKACSCPDHKNDKTDIQIGPPTIINGLVRVTVDMKIYSDYLVKSYPDACIKQRNDTNSRNDHVFRLYKQTLEIALENLKLNCRYSVKIIKMVRETQNITHELCFCTPRCEKEYNRKNCPIEDSDLLPSPINLKFSLLHYDSMTYKVSWEPSDSNIPNKNRLPPITRYRILWAPRKFEPVHLDHYNSAIGFEPIFDFDRSDVRIVRSNITRLLLRNLTKDELYIVRIQSLAISENGQLLESHPITIFLPTHGNSEIYYHNSKRRVLEHFYWIPIVLGAVGQMMLV